MKSKLVLYITVPLLLLMGMTLCLSFELPDPNKVEVPKDPGQTQKLLEACLNGRTRARDMEELIANGADVNAVYNGPERQGWRAIHLCIAYGSVEAVKALVDADADLKGTVARRDWGSGLSVLHLAVLRSFSPYRAFRDKSFTCSFRKAVEFAEVLAEKGGDVNGRIMDGKKAGYTPLHMATELLNKSMVDFLLSKGADVNAAAGNNVSYVDMRPHHILATGKCRNKCTRQGDSLEILKLLVKHGADLESLCSLSLQPGKPLKAYTIMELLKNKNSGPCVQGQEDMYYFLKDREEGEGER